MVSAGVAMAHTVIRSLPFHDSTDRLSVRTNDGQMIKARLPRTGTGPVNCYSMSSPERIRTAATALRGQYFHSYSILSNPGRFAVKLQVRWVI